MFCHCFSFVAISSKVAESSNQGFLQILYNPVNFVLYKGRSSFSWEYILSVVILMIILLVYTELNFVIIREKLSCKYIRNRQSINLNLIKIYNFLRNSSCIEELRYKFMTQISLTNYFTVCRCQVFWEDTYEITH